MASKFYAYLLMDNNLNGVVDSWDKCKNLVQGKKARYKGFTSQKEALEWLEKGANYEKKEEIKEKIKQELPEGIYFDAGTGRGIGVEVRVTDVNGKSLLHHSTYKKFINQFGNISLGKERTNNYGELVGLYIAMEIAQKLQCNNIYGDSNLVIYFWSQGRYKKEGLSEKTVDLIEKVIERRVTFEKNKGKIEYISGDYNPADLGFHK